MTDSASNARRDRGPAVDRGRFASDVQYYLTQTPRQLPSRYLYDELGSALFEAICRLPWYAITRAESSLLASHSGEIFRRLEPLSRIVELGSGSGDKLRLLIEGADAHRSALDVHLVDVSPSALDASARTLRTLRDVTLAIHEAPYEVGLGEAIDQSKSGGRTLVLFLGSNIGNYDPPSAAAWLHDVRRHLADGDALLLGVDLVKPARDLLLAYDDPLGITAAFNRNLLVRINRELNGDFDLQQFAHRAIWKPKESRVEMHLVAVSPQRIHVPAAELDFEMRRDEPIWTESSYKYRPHDVVHSLESAGFRGAAQWIDRRDLFALTLAEAV